MAKLSMTNGGVIKNKGSKSATFKDAKTGKVSYLDSTSKAAKRAAMTPTNTGGTDTTTQNSQPTDEATSQNLGNVGVSETADSLKAKADQIQKDLDSSVASGEIASESTPSPEEYYPRTYAPSTPIEPEPTESAEEIEAEMVRGAQRQINELYDYQNTLLKEQAIINDKNERSTASISALTGTGGSSEANQDQREEADRSKLANRAITDAVSVKVQGILSDIRKEAIIEARERRDDARLDAETKEKNRITRETQAQQHLQLLSQTVPGASLEGLKKTLSEEEYDLLMENAGGEAVAEAILFASRPKNSLLGTPQLFGTKMFQAVQTPEGGIKYEAIDLPEGTITSPIQSVVKDDSGIFIIKEDGTYTKIGGSGIVNPSSTYTGTTNSDGSPKTPIQRDADSVMNGTLNLQDISTAKNYRAQVAAELQYRVEEAKQTGDILGLMKASAAFDKEVSDSFLQSMEKAVTVLDQLSVLQENISGTNTGPLVGSFRGANPWDTNAQTIKAQLNAIVPNLARGIYGEVGVLTDNDIRNYARTIPNLSSTEDVRNAVMYITVDMIRRNVATKIKNQAAGQRDMSGYADIYSQVNDTANNILGSISGAVVPSTNDGKRWSEETETMEVNGKTYVKGEDGLYYEQE